MTLIGKLVRLIFNPRKIFGFLRGMFESPFYKNSTFGCFIDVASQISGRRNIALGRNVRLMRRVRLDAISSYRGQKFMPRLVIGDRVEINNDAHIGAIDYVHIGADTLIAGRVFISDHSHGDPGIFLESAPASRALFSKGPIIIGEKVWIGEGVCIMPGVSIGSFSIIGANSVVTKDIPPACIAAGVPAVVIRKFYV